MSIPITCPGCKAAFDVPDTLTGKTIRCTSCKSQVTVPAVAADVPAAIPVEPTTAQTKKPFGWAGGQDSKPAQAVPVAKAAVPVAAAVPAKATPVAAAVPAKAAPATKKPDENAKTNPAKSAPVAKAVTAKAKNVVADDDEDDEDDSPKPVKKGKGKGKGKDGGSGKMFALVGGGVLAIGAVVGLIVFLSSGKGKQEANTGGGGDNGGAGAAGSAGGPPPGMGGGGPPPGMGGPPGTVPGAGNGSNSDGWQTIQGDGFTVRMPAQPQIQSMQQGTGGGPTLPIKAYICQISPKENYAVVHMDLPPDALSSVGGPQRFLDITSEMMQKRPAGGAKQPSSAGVFGEKLGAFGNMLDGDNITVASAKSVTQDGNPGKEFQLTNSDGSMGVLRMVVAGNRFYLIAGGGSPETVTKAQQLMSSFKIGQASSTGGGIAMGGPGGPPPGSLGGPPGGYGVPPGGTGGPPPGGIGGPPPGMGGVFPTPGGPPPGGIGGPPPGGIGGPPPGGIGGPPPGMGGVFPTPGGPPPGGIGGPPPGMGGVFPTPGGPPPGGIGGPPPGMGGVFPTPGGPPPGGIGGPPPGGIGGPPPGMGGVFPTPGGPPPGGIGGSPPFVPGGNGGQPGANPFPGSTPNGSTGGRDVRPALAQSIEPFFALAFDPEKNDCFTVSPRVVGPRTYGMLKRYSCPEFKLKGTYHIPNLAARGVIDSKKGLLYLATIHIPSSPQGKMQLAGLAFDRVAAVGDIAIYELESLRTGKAEDRSDVKPIGMISVNASIRGLEISDDGKFLYCAVTRTVAGRSKSRLQMIDVTDKKIVKDKDIELPLPAYEMSMSADRKRILVIEMPRSQDKGVSIMEIDPATWTKVRSRSATGPVTDIASHPNGTIVAAVASPNATAKSTPNGRLYALDEDGGSIELAIWDNFKSSLNGYVQFAPDGQHLFVTSYGGMTKQGKLQHTGLDVYKVTGDPSSSKGYKRTATVKNAARNSSYSPVGGYFHVTPDGSHLVFHNGVVLKVATIADNVAPPPPADPGTNQFPGTGQGGAGGFPGAPPGLGGAGGFPGAPGGAPPGGINPGGGFPNVPPGAGMPPGGFNPGGGFPNVPPGAGMPPGGFNPGGGFPNVPPGAGAPPGGFNPRPGGAPGGFVPPRGPRGLPAGSAPAGGAPRGAPQGGFPAPPGLGVPPGAPQGGFPAPPGMPPG